VRDGIERISVNESKRRKPRGGPVRTMPTPRMSLRCGISARGPFLRYACRPPWLDAVCPTRRSTSSPGPGRPSQGGGRSGSLPCVPSYARSQDNILRPSDAVPLGRRSCNGTPRVGTLTDDDGTMHVVLGDVCRSIRIDSEAPGAVRRGRSDAFGVLSGSYR